MDDSSFCIDFKENNTYEIRFNSILSSKIVNGKYKMKDSLIILNHPIEIGRFKIRDTMMIEGKYINYGLLNNYTGEKYIKFPITDYKERCNW